MTLDEAISNLNHLYGMVSPDIQRSLDLAIKALENAGRLHKWLNPDVDPELALERIAVIFAERH